jgi:hypothetical protein
MTTYTRYSGNIASYTPLSAMSLCNGRTPVVMETVMDYETDVMGATDVVNLLYVPAGFIVLATGIEVLKADAAGNSGTVVLKVGSAAQGSAATVAATGFTGSVGSVTPVVASASGAAISLTGATGVIDAVIRVYAVLMDIRSRSSGVIVGTQVAPDLTTRTEFVDQGTYTGLTVVT